MNINNTEYAIIAKDIHKHFRGGIEGAGLNGFDLAVQTGSICGLLGPNGAGKTTAVKILTTLLKSDAGMASVAGFDVATQPRQVREHIGLVGQYAAVDEILTGHQNLVMFGRLYHLSGKQAKQRADELLAQFDLTDAGKIPAGKYSGGMRRRLDLAVSLIVAPPVLFVDEPTTGLDPSGRHEVWAAIRTMVATGTTVLLTTQYLEEADQLANHITMLKAGRVLVEGTPDELKASLGGDWLDIVLRPGDDATPATRIVERVATGEVHLNAEMNRISVPVAERTKALVSVATALAAANIEPHDISLRRPTLDEVFIHLTTASQLDSKTVPQPLLQPSLN